MSLLKLNRNFIYSNQYDKYIASVQYFNKTVHQLQNKFVSGLSNDILPYIIQNSPFSNSLLSPDAFTPVVYTKLNSKLTHVFASAFDNIINGDNRHNNMQLMLQSEKQFFNDNKFDKELNGIYKYIQNEKQLNTYFNLNVVCLMNIVNAIATGNYELLTFTLIKYSHMDLTGDERAVLEKIIQSYVIYHDNNCILIDEDVVKNIKQINGSGKYIENILKNKYDVYIAIQYYDIINDKNITYKVREKIAEYSELHKMMSNVKLDIDECCVCYHDAIQVKLKCNHTVCGGCYSLLKKKNSSCPLCRQVIFETPSYFTNYSNPPRVVYDSGMLRSSYYTRFNNDG